MTSIRTGPTGNRGNTSPGSIFFVGNATVLLRFGGFTILTDPNFIHRGEEVSLGYGLTTRRLTDPALEIEDLPALDLVVVSHFHGDHFDQVAEERLDTTLPILTTPEAAGILQDKGFRDVRALDTWESREIANATTQLRLTAMPARHAPGALTIALPETMGSLLEFTSLPGPGGPPRPRPELRLYITGDTIMYEGLREIPERHPEIDLALVHLGGTRVMGVTVTMDAEQGVELLQTVTPRLAIPIHYNDYEAFKSPLSDFVAAVEDAGFGGRVRYLQHGDTFDLGEVSMGGPVTPKPRRTGVRADLPRSAG